MKPVPEHHALRRLFKGLVENAFCAELGLCDPELAGYVADLLVKFSRADALWALRDAEGRRLDQIADMLMNLTCGTDGVRGEEELLVHRHIGDFALFWSGLYPEHLQRRGRRGLPAKDRLLDYVVQGKRSYAIASRLTDQASSPPSSLLERLSAEFDSCRQGLELVRRGWSQTDPAGHDQARDLLF